MTGGATTPRKQQKPKGNPGGSYSNTMKMNKNFSYCYSCGYDVDHTGWQCHANTRKQTHINNAGRDKAHKIAGASMQLQHKNLTYGSGSGKGWILAQKLRNTNWVMNQQYIWKQHHQQQKWRG